jgi:hypothetical protein
MKICIIKQSINLNKNQNFKNKKMKKTLLLVLTLILFSCSSSKKTVENPLFDVLTQQADGGASIRFFEILTEPNEVQMLENDENLRNKIKPNDIANANFIVLNMGEKATGGYTIGIESAIETDKNIIITVKETTPEPGAMVTQGFTSPFCVVRINSKKEIIIK